MALAVLAVPMCLSGIQPEAAELTQQTELEITAYDGFGLVKTKWTGLLPAGYAKVGVPVPEQIDVDTLVFESRGVTLIEQDYSYDLVNLYRLYEEYVGKEIVAKVKSGDGVEVIAGTLLSYQGDSIILEDLSGKIHVANAEAVELPALPEGLTTEPTVSWLVQSIGGNKEVEMSYLTSGLSWDAQYNAMLSGDESQLELRSMVSVTNNAGADFEDAKLTLVAGDVNRVAQYRSYAGAMPMAEDAVASKTTEQFASGSTGEYHTYELERRVSLNDASSKQIPFFSETVAVEKEYVFDSSEPVWFSDNSAQGVAVKLKFDATRPMPAGKVRVYSQDPLTLLGEDSVDHTARDESVRLNIGSAFDIVGERTQTKYDRIGDCSYEASYEVQLRNHKTEDVTVTVVEHVWGDTEVVSSSLPVYEDEAQKKSWRVGVPSESESTLTYTLRRTC